MRFLRFTGFIESIISLSDAFRLEFQMISFEFMILICRFLMIEFSFHFGEEKIALSSLNIKFVDEMN